MELVLNILWLLIALGGVSVWRMRWAQQARSRRHEPWHEWTAFVCALVLLFFVVSLTDDLHAELIVLEECCASRRHVNCLHSAHDSRQPDHFPTGPVVAIIAASAHSTDFAFEPLFVSAPNSLCVSPEQKSHSGRAPPIAI